MCAVRYNAQHLRHLRVYITRRDTVFSYITRRHDPVSYDIRHLRDICLRMI
jgi:hypothetical protein